MKMSKKILPALAMLIVSAIMLSTASFAWFAMSTEVSATNMQVSITSDATNLVIAESSSAITTNSAYNTLNFDFNSVAAKALLPIAFDANADTLATAFKTDTMWYTQTSNNPEVSDSNNGSKTNIAYATVLEKYVLHKTFFVGVTAGSNDMENLKAKVTIDKVDASSQASIDPVRVLVVSTDEKGYQNFTTTTLDYTGSVVIASSITDENPVQVDIYIYYDGNDDDVTSKNFAAQAISNAKVSVFFTASKVTAQQNGNG